MSEDKKFIPSPHHYSRQDRDIQGIVIHRMGGTCEGSITWFQNPESEVSAHYLVCQDGKITQMVRDHEAAWHAGYKTANDLPDWLQNVKNPNWATIGIECEDQTTEDVSFWTDPQLNTLLSLCKILVQEYNIPIDRDHILGHSDIDPKRKPNCPGSHFPWEEFLGYLREEIEKEDVSKDDEELLERVKKLFEENKKLTQDLETTKQNLKVQDKTINKLDENLADKELKIRELEETLRQSQKLANEKAQEAKKNENLAKDMEDVQKVLRNALGVLERSKAGQSVEKGVNWLKLEFDTSKFYIRWAQIFLWAGLSAVLPVILTFVTGRVEFLGLQPFINASAKALLDWVERRKEKVVEEE